MRITDRARQIELFWWLPVTCRALQRRRRMRRMVLVVALPSGQLSLKLQVSYLDDEDDDPLISAPMIRRTVSAATAPPPVATGGFVFNLAGLTLGMQSRRAQPVAAPTIRVERLDGVVRCTRILSSETAEWQERERVRRAKQTPPKPTRRAKTKGRMISGLPSWDDVPSEN